MAAIPTSANDMLLYKKDLVLLTGEVPFNSVVPYSHQMKGMLNDKKEYTINRIIKYQQEKNENKIGVGVAGWVWDPRNITKIIRHDLNKKEPIVFFNIDDLDMP